MLHTESKNDPENQTRMEIATIMLGQENLHSSITLDQGEGDKKSDQCEQELSNSKGEEKPENLNSSASESFKGEGDEKSNRDRQELSIHEDMKESMVLSAPAEVPLDQAPSSLVTGEGIQGTSGHPVNVEQIHLREWARFENFLSQIPEKAIAQKERTTLDLKLTCIAAVEEFLAVGTNVGLVYWYNRKTDYLRRLKTDITNSPISVISVISSVDYMLAAGNQEGRIKIFQIPKKKFSNTSFKVNNDTECFIDDQREIQTFSVKDLHHCVITTLEWSSNGMKLFSGDGVGTVVLTEIDYVERLIKSRIIIEEKYAITQLSYAKQHLLVCSTFRAIVFSLSKNASHQVGTQDRKIQGNFGGIFQPTSFSEDSKLYSVRPGGRIWVANASGVVEHTIKFKDLLLQNRHSYIPVINPNLMKNKSQDFQIGVLRQFMKTYLATFYKGLLYVLDPVNTRIVGLCQELRSIVDIAVTDSEIFVLESDRNIVRLSSSPDKFEYSYSTQSTDFLAGVAMLPSIMSASIADFRLPEKPMNFLTSKLKETSRALPKILKNVIEAEVDIQNGSFMPPIIPLRDIVVPNIAVEDETGQEQTEHPLPVVEDKFKHISQQPFEEVLLYPIKKRTKRRAKDNKDLQFLSSEDTVSQSDAVSLCSAYSTNSEGEAATGALRRLSSQSDSAQSSQSASTTSEPVRGAAGDPKSFPQSMSQSWTVGQLENHDVSVSDLETKEEILARKLNWPELLPPSARHIFIDQNDMSKLSSKSSVEKTDGLFGWRFERHDSDTPDGHDDGCDGSSSIVTLKEANGDKNVCEPNLTSSASSLTSSVLVEEGMNESASADIEKNLDNESINVFEQSVDIYTKYAARDDSHSASLNSALSFGPPSGSSAVLAIGRQSGDNSLEPKIIEVKEEVPSSNPLSNSLVKVRDMVVDPIVVGNDSWISYKAPASLQSISACDSYVMSTDLKNNVYYSRLDDVSLRWIQTDYQANKLAISSCGAVLWRLYKGTLYSLMCPSIDGPTGLRNGDWSKLCSQVASMAVKRHVGWIIKVDGTVHICSGLLESAMVPEFEKVTCPWVASQIVVLDSAVWAVTADGRVIYRNGVTENNCVGTEWLEKKWDEPMPLIVTICVGPSNSVWVADVHNNLYFVSDVSETCYEGNSYPWKVSLGEYAFCNGIIPGNGSNGGGSWRSRITDSFRPDRITSLLSSKASPIINGTSSTIWFSASGSTTLHVSKTQADGHGWTSIKVSRPLKSFVWNNILAGSIYKEHGCLWLLDSKGKMFYSRPEGGELKPLDLPCSSQLVCIAPAPDALWILNDEGIVYGRCNISSINPIGHSWDKIDLSTLANVNFVHISCGSDVAWACGKKGNIYMRVGKLRPPGVNDISPAWVEVDGSPQESTKNCFFTKVYVGTNGSMVWALDNHKNIYVREAIYPDFPIGTRWLLVSGIEATSLAVSDKAVWAMTPKGEVFRRCGISTTNFVGDYWKKIPGTIKVLTVSLCDHVWALENFGQLIKHCQITLNFNEKKKREKPKLVLDPEDKDWELVESL